jgi:hypothetical protein
MRKRGPTVNKLYDEKLSAVKNEKLTKEQRKSAMLPVLGLCMGIGVKLWYQKNSLPQQSLGLLCSAAFCGNFFQSLD